MSRKSALIIILLGVFTAFIIVGFTRLFVFRLLRPLAVRARVLAPGISDVGTRYLYGNTAQG